MARGEGNNRASSRPLYGARPSLSHTPRSYDNLDHVLDELRQQWGSSHPRRLQIMEASLEAALADSSALWRRPLTQQSACRMTRYVGARIGNHGDEGASDLSISAWQAWRASEVVDTDKERAKAFALSALWAAYLNERWPLADTSLRLRGLERRISEASEALEMARHDPNLWAELERALRAYAPSPSA